MSDDASEKPEIVEVNGITEDDFNRWRHHPATKAVLQYLQDYEETMKIVHMERWMAGAVVSDEEQERRGRLLAVSEIRGLSFAGMFDFYAQGEPEEE